MSKNASRYIIPQCTVSSLIGVLAKLDDLNAPVSVIFFPSGDDETRNVSVCVSHDGSVSVEGVNSEMIGESAQIDGVEIIK